MATLMLLSGCDGAKPSEQAQSWRAEGKTMGTYYRVLVANPLAAALTGLNQAIEQRLAEDNYQISTWQDDTILSRFNRYHGTEPQPITPDMADIISTALRIGAKTGGAMDITIGARWGTCGDSARKNNRQRRRMFSKSKAPAPARWAGASAAY